ncbi:syntaxin-7-like [Clytia hemisphaerica]
MSVSDHGTKYSSNGQNYSDDGGDTELSNLFDDVGRNIQQIIRKTGLMQKLINQRTTLENETFERLQSEQKNANKLIKDTSLQFQILDNLQTTDFETARQKSIQQEKLKQNFSDALRNFQKVQKLVAEKEKTEVQRARALPIDGSHHLR